MRVEPGRVKGVVVNRSDIGYTRPPLVRPTTCCGKRVVAYLDALRPAEHMQIEVHMRPPLCDLRPAILGLPERVRFTNKDVTKAAMRTAMTCFRIKDNHDYILIGCDGVFEKLENEEVAEKVWASAM